MRKFKKVMAALLAGTLVMGSVGVIPTEAAVDAESVNIFYQQDFEGVNYTNLGYTTVCETGTEPEVLTVVEDDLENDYLFFETGTTLGGTNKITIPLNNVSESFKGTLWVEFKIYSTSASSPQRFQAHLSDGDSMINNNRIVFKNSAWRNAYTGANVGSFATNTWNEVSCKIEVGTNTGTLTYFVNGTQLYTRSNAAYGSNSLSCQNLTLSIPVGATDPTPTTGAGYRIDNLAVYESDTQVDVFAEPTGITLDKDSVQLEAGSTEQLTATVETTGIIPEITWTSDNGNVATVSDTGLVTAKRAGKATITAKAGNVETTCTVNVGVDDVLFMQDFDETVALDENGLNLACTEGAVSQVIESTNGYLYLEGSDEAGNLVQVPFVNELTNTTVWIEMDVLIDTDDLNYPKTLSIYAYGLKGNSSNVASLATTMVSYIRKPGDTSMNYDRLSNETWMRLSYKIEFNDSKTGTYTAYVDGKETYTASYAREACNYLRVTIAKNEGNASRGVKIDNLAVYANETQTDLFAPEIKGTNLSLDGNIGVKYHMDLRGIIGTKRNDAYVQFGLPNGSTKKVPVSEATYDSTTNHYVFPCEVAAKEMTSEITTQVFDGSNVALTEAIDYTVRDNAAYIVKYGTSDYPAYEKAKPLAEALLNYGAYAQQHFEVNTDKLANAAIDGTEIAITPDNDSVKAAIEADYASIATEGDALICLFSGSLSLDSETALNVYLSLTDLSNYKIECDGKEVEAQLDETLNLYYVRLMELAQRDLMKLM